MYGCVLFVINARKGKFAPPPPPPPPSVDALLIGSFVAYRYSTAFIVIVRSPIPGYAI